MQYVIKASTPEETLLEVRKYLLHRADRELELIVPGGNKADRLRHVTRSIAFGDALREIASMVIEGGDTL